MVVNEVREMNMPALLTRVYKEWNRECTSETVAVFKGKVFASSEEHDANQHLQSPYQLSFQYAIIHTQTHSEEGNDNRNGRPRKSAPQTETQAKTKSHQDTSKSSNG